MSSMHCQNCGAALDGFETFMLCPYCGVKLTAMLAQALRLELFGGDTHLLLPRDTPLPASVSFTFSTGLDGQTSAQVHVLQGDKTQVDGNRSLGNYVFTDLEPRPRGVPQITFTFTIDGVGHLEVQVREEESGREQLFSGTQVAVLRQ